MSGRARPGFGCDLGLATLTILAYLPVLRAGFVYDDEVYLLANPRVTSGLTWEGFRWAFTTFTAGNWYPLTWLSHMTDAQLFGMRPSGHHMTNLLLHVAASLVLFHVLRLMTGTTWRAAVVSALFALHPLHVESVAWVSERKDVLSTLFFVLALGSWWHYARRRTGVRYGGVLVLFVLGLLCKAMLVTFPFVLLLLDWWPLGRLGSRREEGFKRRAVFLLLEKLPMLACSAAAAVVTFIAQREGGAVGTLESYPFSLRVANAAVTYLRYIFKMIVPADLSVFYPYPDAGVPRWLLILSLTSLLASSALVLRFAWRLPYLAVGWFWYLGTLVPVIGLVQVGRQAMADRYTYVPLIGLFVLIAWGVDALSGSWNRRQVVLAVGTAVVVLGAAAATWHQVGHWRNGETLFTHAIRTDPDNWLAHFNYGQWLAREKRVKDAAREFMTSAELRPEFSEAHYNLAVAFIDLGRRKEAILHLREALRSGFLSEVVQTALAEMLLREGDATGSLDSYAEALRLRPQNAEALVNYGVALTRVGRLEEAVQQYRAAVRLRPDMPKAYMNLGNALSDLGRNDEAIGFYRQALILAPNSAETHYNLALTLERMGLGAEAIASYRRVLTINPGFAPARSGLGRLTQ